MKQTDRLELTLRDDEVSEYLEGGVMRAKVIEALDDMLRDALSDMPTSTNAFINIQIADAFYYGELRGDDL